MPWIGCVQRDQPAHHTPRRHFVARTSTTHMTVNWWLLMAGLGAIASAGGHAFAGEKMFRRSMRVALSERIHQGIFDNVWYIVSIHFAVLGIALLLGGFGRGDGLFASFVSAQLGACAALALGISLRLGGISQLPQWMLFAAVALLAALGASSSYGGIP
jgi:hypothetical protein